MITANMLVKNEENFVWYSIMSVLDFVDKIIIWDTGSTDKTVEIIKSIKSPKIVFEEKGVANNERISLLRNEMLLQTNSDWIMIVDGDEVWHRKTLHEVKNIIENENCDVIIHSTKMLIGDMYHYQEEEAGKYRIGNRTGHYNLRFFKNTSGIRVAGNYPNEAYVNSDNVKLQDLENIYFARNPYLHASHLIRSSKDKKKIKYEIGNNFPLDYFYPESLFFERPKIVGNAWKSIDFNFKFIAYLETPLKKLKRRLV